jgi:hypothetical protein
MKTKKFSQKDIKLREWLIKGGRKQSKPNFFTLLKRAAKAA